MGKDIPVDDADPTFRHTFTVEESAIDKNGHVNNVVYIQWMQDVAIQHALTCRGAALTEKLGCSWIVRSHSIDYLSPAFAGDRIVAITWVWTSARSVHSANTVLCGWTTTNSWPEEPPNGCTLILKLAAQPRYLTR